MDYERKHEAKVLGHAIGEAIGEEVKKVYSNNRSNDFAKEYREKDEFRYKSLLYFVNISVIISYIAGALAIQLPFIDKFGIMLYDFKLYLLIGAMIFVIVQIAVFTSSIYEQFAAVIAVAIEDVIMKKFNNYEMQGLQWIARTIIFIPVAELLMYFGRKWVTNSVNEKYWGILFAILLFIKIYVILSLTFQNKRYSSSMNTTNFVLILVALTVSLYTSRASFEEYLLTNARLINNQSEKSIELLLVDGRTIYYKENNIYKCGILETDTVIEYKSIKN
ncbi:MAG: hypothetical protein CVV02_05405 [Firmicutes bacterium HGW-Firmicutes-7]|nr:MAG: hypothetical protein CVV02_05405 [Firmicutes bacterium HGW-Firmicutes-7]